MWEDGFLVNEKNKKVLEIQGGNDRENNNISINTKNG
jgi:hypothetical protein